MEYEIIENLRKDVSRFWWSSFVGFGGLGTWNPGIYKYFKDTPDRHVGEP